MSMGMGIGIGIGIGIGMGMYMCIGWRMCIVMPDCCTCHVGTGT